MMEDVDGLDFDPTCIADDGTGDFVHGIEDLSQLNLDPAEGQGDHTDLFEDYCFEGNSPDMFLPSAYSSDNSSQEDWQNLNWEEDLNSDDDGDDLDYTPISQLLANSGQERDEWYDHPDDEEFRSAFACLNTRKTLAKKYLLEMLNPCDDYSPPLPDAATDPIAIAEVNYALSELCIPRLSRMSVEKLSNILIKHPSLDLRNQLEDFDVFTVAYVIWGIDFYMNRKCFNYSEDENKSVDDDYSIHVLCEINCKNESQPVGFAVHNRCCDATFIQFISAGAAMVGEANPSNLRVWDGRKEMVAPESVLNTLGNEVWLPESRDQQLSGVQQLSRLVYKQCSDSRRLFPKYEIDGF